MMRPTLRPARLAFGLGWGVALPALALAAATALADIGATRVAIVSDSHITRGTNESQPFHRGRFERTIAAVNAAGVDLVLIAGDLTENGTSPELREFRRLLRRFDAPVACVPGNHDVGGKWIPGKTNQNDFTRSRLETYERILGDSWFVRDLAGLRVVGVNGSLLGTGLPEEQAMWTSLSNALAAPQPRPAVALIHYPLYADKPDEPGGVYWNVEPGPRERLWRLFQQGSVRVIASGHLHREILRWQDDVLLLTSPPVSFGLPQDRQYRGWTLLTVPAEGRPQAEFRYILD